MSGFVVGSVHVGNCLGGGVWQEWSVSTVKRTGGGFWNLKKLKNRWSLCFEFGVDKEGRRGILQTMFSSSFFLINSKKTLWSSHWLPLSVTPSSQLFRVTWSHWYAYSSLWFPPSLRRGWETTETPPPLPTLPPRRDVTKRKRRKQRDRQLVLVALKFCAVMYSNVALV